VTDLADRHAPVDEGKIRRTRKGGIQVGPETLGSTGPKGSCVPYLERSKEPVKAKFVDIILGNFEELRFDLDLRGLDTNGGVYERVNEIDGIRSIADDEFAAGWNILSKGAAGKSDALGLQIFEGIRPASDAGLQDLFTWRTRRGNFSAPNL
jgi:hypothetical protein